MKKLKLNRNIIIDNIEDEVIVFNEETQNTHVLNSTAGFLLNNADKSTMVELIDKLYHSLSEEDRLNMDKACIVSECEECINTLISCGLLE